jgi:hypothetical protein
MLRRTALCGAVLCLWGCASLPGYEPAHFRVELSPLDYAQILLQPGTGAGGGDIVPTRIDVSGSGLVTMQRGRSARVTSSFWDQPQGDDWDDYETDRVFLPESETRAVFQALVNAGIFERGQREDPSPQAPRCVVILAEINGRKNAVVTDGERFLNIFDQVMRRFR